MCVCVCVCVCVCIIGTIKQYGYFGLRQQPTSLPYRLGLWK